MKDYFTSYYILILDLGGKMPMTSSSFQHKTRSLSHSHIRFEHGIGCVSPIDVSYQSLYYLSPLIIVQVDP